MSPEDSRSPSPAGPIPRPGHDVTPAADCGGRAAADPSGPADARGLTGVSVTPPLPSRAARAALRVTVSLAAVDPFHSLLLHTVLHERRSEVAQARAACGTSTAMDPCCAAHGHLPGRCSALQLEWNVNTLYWLASWLRSVAQDAHRVRQATTDSEWGCEEFDPDCAEDLRARLNPQAADVIAGCDPALLLLVARGWIDSLMDLPT